MTELLSCQLRNLYPDNSLVDYFRNDTVLEFGVEVKLYKTLVVALS